MLKTAVGTTRPTIYSLPSEQHKYGKASPTRDYTMEEGKHFFILLINHFFSCEAYEYEVCGGITLSHAPTKKFPLAQQTFNQGVVPTPSLPIP